MGWNLGREFQQRIYLYYLLYIHKKKQNVQILAKKQF